jgi:hypothetical protein
LFAFILKKTYIRSSEGLNKYSIHLYLSKEVKMPNDTNDIKTLARAIVEAITEERRAAFLDEYHCEGVSYECNNSEGYKCGTAKHTCSGAFSCKGRSFKYNLMAR